MGSLQKESRRKAEREAAKRERALEREHPRAAAPDGLKVAAPPVAPPKPRHLP